MSFTFPSVFANTLNSVVYLLARWSDGTSTFGSGVLVGPNDVLTAAHVVTKPGATLVDLDVRPLYRSGFYSEVNSDGVGGNYRNFQITSINGQISDLDASRDLAIVGLEWPLGQVFDWLQIRPDAPSGQYRVVGYPGEQQGRLTSDVDFSQLRGPPGSEVFGLQDFYIRPGSSGGPLLDGLGRVVGVVSTSIAGARIDVEYDQILRWIAENDFLLGNNPNAPDDHADRVADGRQLPGGIVVGAIRSGALESVGDSDILQVYMSAGGVYRFDVGGLSSRAGTLADATLHVYDSSGNIIALDNNSGPGGDPAIAFVAPRSGLYFLQVTHVPGSDPGTYLLSASQLAGRRPGFDAEAYAALNPDLLRAFGADANALVAHYVSSGRAEGRNTEGFSAEAYAALNPDVYRALGLDPGALANHYLTFGRAEERPTMGFDAEAYAALNPDLFRAFGTDTAALVNHFISNGRAEGRLAEGFSVEAYAALNPDLFRAFGLDSRALVDHFVNFGRAEGRATQGFDAETYAALNPDLFQAFGLNQQALVDHYINYGSREGRPGTDALPVPLDGPAPSPADLPVADAGLDLVGYQPLDRWIA